MRFLFLAVSLLSSSLMVGCVGDPAVIGPPPKDGSVPDQQAADGGLGDAGDGAISDPTWTLPLLKGISLGPIAVDPNGDVYVGGSIMDAFTLDAINIPTTQKNDGIVLKLDGKTKKAVWAKVIAGSGIDGITSMQFQSGALYIVGITDSPFLAFSKTAMAIPAAMPVATRSFIAKLDATDGAEIFTYSPDASRTANTTFSSLCSSLSVVAKRVAVGCTYSGANFNSSAPVPANQSSALAVMAYDDKFGLGFTWQRYLAGSGVLVPIVAVDTSGDVVLGATRRGTQPLVDLVESSAVLPAQTTQGNPFVLRLDGTTGAVHNSKIWSADAASGLHHLSRRLALGQSTPRVGSVLRSRELHSEGDFRGRL